jgi:repressor LexA
VTRAALNRAKRKRPLTRRQAQILAFVRRFMDRNGYAPTVEEIAEHYGLWRNGCQQHLELIAKKGHLRRAPNVARGLVLL